MDLTCYVHPGWAPRIRPASPKRAWMDDTPERYAYRCLPLAIANAHGWEIGSPCGFEAKWNGGPGIEAIEIRLDPDTRPEQAPVSLFGQGVLTFHIEGLIRTSPGWNLWVGGSPNLARDAIAPLGGVIETDWSPYSFTMNWRFTRPGQWVRWEVDEPFCFFFPVQRGVMEAVRPTIRPLSDAPELEEAFKSWSASRDAFHEHVRRTKPSSPTENWQKLYYRGIGPNGEPGADDHQAKLRLAPFSNGPGLVVPKASCPAAKPARAPQPATLAAPVQRSEPGAALLSADTLNFALRNIGFDAKAEPRQQQPDVRLFAKPEPGVGLTPPVQSAPPPLAPLERDLARRDWILRAMEDQRALSPLAGGISRVQQLSSEEFLDNFYAAGRPVVIEGEMDGWPALERWTPAYLARLIGSAEVMFQGGRNDDPEFELYKDKHTRRIRFNSYIKNVTQPGAGNDAYITAYNSADNGAALAPLHRELGQFDKFLTPGPGMAWIGPAGTFTPLHFDLTNNLLAQVVGRKKLILIPPSETSKLANNRHVFSDVHDITDPARLARFPLAAYARRFEIDLGPGDLLYIPVGWWHQVRSLSFSVMMTYTNFRWPNDAHASFPSDGG